MSYRSSKSSRSPSQWQLDIKTGVASRLCWDYTCYQREADKQRGTIQKMKNRNEDEYEIKRDYKDLDETLAMLSHIKKRFEQAYEELAELTEDPENEGTKELAAALYLLSKFEMSKE